MKIKNSEKNIYTTPRIITSIDECDFYHVMDIPGYGVVGDEWDLRHREQQYLGGVNFKGKRVLELGTASGFFCFYMEKQGAEVVAYDLSENLEWDIVPMCQYDYKKHIQTHKGRIKRINNGYWYAYKAYNSKAKVVYGSVYEIPEEIGMVDITAVCAILHHVRDPFLALQKALRLTKETVIVTDLTPDPPLFTLSPLRRFACLVKRYIFLRPKTSVYKFKTPYMEFLPNFRTLEHKEAWWYLSPEIIVSFLGVLGFEKTQTTYHVQKLKNGSSMQFFTVVGKRTRGISNQT